MKATQPEPFLRVHYLEKTYRDAVPGLARTSFALDRGGKLLVRGRHGTGKSTLLDILFCSMRPTRGQVLLAGDSILKLSTHDVALHRRRTGFFRPSLPLSPRKTIEENIAYPLRVAGAPLAQAAAVTAGLLSRFSLDRVRGFYPEQTPPLERALVLLARSLAKSPQLLLVDDPGEGLDPNDARRFASLLVDAWADITCVVASNRWSVPGMGTLELCGATDA